MAYLGIIGSGQNTGKRAALIKTEEALLMFGKWRDESTPLRVVAVLYSGYLSVACTVFKFSAELIALRLAGEDNFSELVLRDFDFEYGEPPEGHGTESVLIAVRDTERIFFMELRAET